jgi:ssDNA-binding Zn-finger/Zn-ribbon topoisomerase 1
MLNMTCPNCEQGALVMLRTKGQLLPYQEMPLLEQLKMEQDLLKQMHSILMQPERHYKNVQCPHCKSTQIEYHGNGDNYINEADEFNADQGIIRDARAALN